MSDQPKTTKDRRLHFALSEEMDHRLAELSLYHRKSKGELVRLGVALVDAITTRAYLDGPLGAAELGDDLEEARANVEDTLKGLTETASQPTYPPPFRASLN